MSFLGVQLITALAFSALLFLLAIGFTLIFGMMNIVNLAHGSYFVVGSYVGLSVLVVSGNFYLAVLGGGLALALLGIVQEIGLFRRFHGKPLDQVLLTLAMSLVFDQMILVIWGSQPQEMPPPGWLVGPLTALGITFPKYRLALIVVGAVTALAMWLLIEKTKIGAIVRAGVDNEEIARAMGIDVDKAFVFVFALGSFLAGMGGVLGAPMLELQPAMSSTVLPLAIVVVIIGGPGSFAGALAGSLFVGLVDSFGKAYFPQFSYFTLFVPMALILAFRPQGIFGRA
jgi:branched-chain amino acid transport system permease protein